MKPRNTGHQTIGEEIENSQPLKLNRQQTRAREKIARLAAKADKKAIKLKLEQIGKKLKKLTPEERLEVIKQAQALKTPEGAV